MPVAVSETSSVSSQVSTPRRSKRIAALRVLSDNKSFSQFEQLVDTIVEKKFRFNPVNEIITYDDSVVDTMNAFVYKQIPVEGTENIDLGVFVHLWFTEDSSKLVEDMIELMRQDSLKARLDSILND